MEEVRIRANNKRKQGLKAHFSYLLTPSYLASSPILRSSLQALLLVVVVDSQLNFPSSSLCVTKCYTGGQSLDLAEEVEGEERDEEDGNE